MSHISRLIVKVLSICFLLVEVYSFSAEIQKPKIFHRDIEDIYYEAKILYNENGIINGFYFTIHNSSTVKDYQYYFEKSVDSAFSIKFYNCKIRSKADSSFNLNREIKAPLDKVRTAVHDGVGLGNQDSLQYEKILLRKESSYSKFIMVPSKLKEKIVNKNSQLFCEVEINFKAFIYIDESQFKQTLRVHKRPWASRLGTESAGLSFYGDNEFSEESFSKNTFKDYLKSKDANSIQR